MPKPPFSSGRRWDRRASHAGLDGRVWYDRDNGREYVPDDNPLHDHWHEIDPRRREYRAINPVTGDPVAGHEGQWRQLR